MIDGRMVFPQTAKWPALSAFFRLPVELRPTAVSVGEVDAKLPIQAGDDLHRLLGWRSGFLLHCPSGTYNVSTSDPQWITFHCDMEIQPALAQMFLIHMAGAHPLFAYLCKPEEEVARNRIKDIVGVNTIESWVGRNIDRYVPGLYWLTLLSEALAARHALSIDSIAGVALERCDLRNGQHLLRFYERPEDWSRTDAVSLFCSSTPGIFSVDQVRSCLSGRETLMSYLDIVSNWR